MESTSIRQRAATRSESWETSECVLDVYCWRQEQLLAAGYGRFVADSLAEDPRVDLHLACDLLAHGCDQATAHRILS